MKDLIMSLNFWLLVCFILNLFGIKHVVNEGNSHLVWGGFFVGTLLLAILSWRLDLVIYFSDTFDTAVFGSLILNGFWTLICVLYKIIKDR